MQLLTGLPSATPIQGISTIDFWAASAEANQDSHLSPPPSRINTHDNHPAPSAPSSATSCRRRTHLQRSGHRGLRPSRTSQSKNRPPSADNLELRYYSVFGGDGTQRPPVDPHLFQSTSEPIRLQAPHVPTSWTGINVGDCQSALDYLLYNVFCGTDDTKIRCGRRNEHTQTGPSDLIRMASSLPFQSAGTILRGGTAIRAAT
jgi:hypothetical protein